MTKIINWIDSLPPTACRIVLRAGESRKAENQVSEWTEWQGGVSIEHDITDQRQGFTTARLIAYDDKSKQIRATNLPDKQVQSTESDTGLLVQGILSMAGEMRRFQSVITSTLEKREDTLSDMIDHLMTAREERMQSDMHTMSLQMELSKAEETQDHDIKSRAVEAIEGLATSYLESKMKPQQITLEIIKTAILESPELIRQAMADPDIMNLLTVSPTE